MNKLKIYSHLPSIINLIRNNSSITVVAPTGIGKSLGIPWGISKTKSKVFVSTPTIVSAISLYKTLKSYSKDLNIGYAAEGNINYDDKTDIVYATSGHIYNKILKAVKDDDFNFTNVLIIDEYHLHKADNDIVINLWNYLKSQGKKIPRLILLSATPDELKKTDTFYQIKEEGFPIEIFYSKKSYEYLNEINKKIIDIHLSSTKGHILVFVPGSFEVEFIINGIKHLKNSLVLGAYSEMNQDKIQLIHIKTEKNVRKIIVATNILETSITVEDVGVVIDSMLENRARTSQIDGLELVKSDISKDSAKQRCGRTGRTMSGICYRIISKEEFDKLEEHTPYELERIPIHKYVVDIFVIGLDPIIIFGEKMSKKIRTSNSLLNHLNLINKETKEITNIGKFVFKLPLEIRLSTILWHWLDQKLPPFPLISAVSLLNNWSPSYFDFPKKKNDSNDYNTNIKEFNEKIMKFKSTSSLGMLVNMWINLIDFTEGIEDIDQSKLKKWSEENGIKYKKIKEGIKITKHVMEIISNLDFKVSVGPFTYEGFMKKARPIFENIYSDRIMKLKSKEQNISYFHQPTSSYYTLDMRDRNSPEELVAIITTNIVTKTGRKLSFISFYLDIEKDTDVKLSKIQEESLKHALSIFQ